MIKRTLLWFLVWIIFFLSERCKGAEAAADQHPQQDARETHSVSSCETLLQWLSGPSSLQTAQTQDKRGDGELPVVKFNALSLSLSFAMITENNFQPVRALKSSWNGMLFLKKLVLEVDIVFHIILFQLFFFFVLSGFPRPVQRCSKYPEGADQGCATVCNRSEEKTGVSSARWNWLTWKFVSLWNFNHDPFHILHEFLFFVIKEIVYLLPA